MAFSADEYPLQEKALNEEAAEEDPLDSFELAEGFQIELIASEPLIADPVAMEVDENGTIYVAEMPGYPLDVSGKGRIKILRDTNGDGVIDESTIFADNIVLPTGLMRWKNGLLVTSPPDVLYLEDTNKDGVAETRIPILTGFARSNPQHNFNKPVYGLDNWIYVANNGIIWTSAYKAQFGGRGEAGHYPAQPESPRLGTNANDRNIRFKPDSFELESLAGRSQFGHTFDAWGHHFLLNNASPQYHEVIAARYLERNPALSTRMAMQYTPTYGRNTAIYPITRDPEHQLLTDRGMITSAAGITYYQGGLFPEPYQNVTFVGEPVHNLIHVLKVKEKGATFEASRIEERKEFLASTDGWFRPVNYYVGPDGALYVIDYYRQIVEHPEWMDDETAKSGKLKNGTESGRIYRITPTGTAHADWMGALNLGTASTDALVSHLQSSNLWWRKTAQRLLVDRQDMNAVPLLEEILNTSKSAEARLHALWTLEGLKKLEPAHIQTGLQDEEAGVRENAVILAELHANEHPQLWDALLSMQDEPNTRVRFQMLCTLGYMESEKSLALRQQILTRDIDDPWIQLAALTTYSQVDYALMDALLPALTASESAGRASFTKRIASLIAATNNTDQLNLLGDLALDTQENQESNSTLWWQKSILEGIAEGLPRNARSNAGLILLRNKLMAKFTAETAEAYRSVLLDVVTSLPAKEDNAVVQSISAAKNAATNEAVLPELRAQSIALIAYLEAEKHATLFKNLITSTEPNPVQQAAIRAYGDTGETDLARVLIDSWPALTPDVRNTALDVLMQSDERMVSILNAVEDGIIQPSAIGWDRTVRLMRDTEGTVKEKARMLLSEPAGVRDEVVASYYASLALDGDLDNGATTFTRVCSTCHQVGGEMGVVFGPDLGTVRHWSAKALLAKVLKPQKTIADGYGLWSIKLHNNQTETGLIATESPTSIQLRRLGQAELTIPREEVASLESLNTTAMPAGLESQISKQEMADLIAFLRFN